MTYQCLTDYIKVAFHMLMPLNLMSTSLMIVMMMIMHLLMIVIQIISSSCQVFNFVMLYLMMIHLSYIHIIIHVGIFLCCNNFIYSLSWQVLKDGGHGSRALRGPFFVGAWWEGFHSTRTSPPSVVGQYVVTARPFFIAVGAHRGTR